MTSDLDLVLVYDTPQDVESDGDRPLPPSTYFHRLLRRLLTALGAGSSRTGQIYEIDMRLRPSGNAGPLATSLRSFQDYHERSAWTWERMALTRARVVHGPDRIAKKLNDTISATLSKPRNLDELRNDVAKMRERMANEFRTHDAWSIKHRRGGLVDIEFIAQYLLLVAAQKDLSVVTGNTGEALANLAAAGYLSEPDAGDLRDAWALWTRLQALQRLIGENANLIDVPLPLQGLFTEAAKLFDVGELPDRMETAYAQVLDAYNRIVGAPQAIE